MPTSDLDLLRGYVVGGSEAAYRELVRRHADLVFSSAMRRVGNDSHLAEDVTQQVFVELARNGRKLLSRRTLEGWLYTTTRFKAVDLVRSERRRRSRELASIPMNSEPVNFTREQIWQQVGPLLENAMDSLSDRDREVLLLRFFREKSFAETGQRLGLTEDAARKRSERALERLRVAFAKRGIRSTVEALGLVIAGRAVGMPPDGLVTSVTSKALFSAQSVKGAGIFHLLTATKMAAAIGTMALLLASVGTAIHEVRERTRASEDLAFSLELTAAAKTRLSDIARREHSSETKVAALRRALAAASNGASHAGAGASLGSPKEAGRQFSAKHPEVETLTAAHARAGVERSYGPLLWALGLGAEKSLQFSDLIAHQGSQAVIQWNTALDPDHPSIETGSEAEILSSDRFAEKMQALLGADGYQQFQNYRINGVQQIVQQLAGTLYSTDSPIAQAQAEQLVQVLAQSNPSYQNGGKIPAVSQINWNAALASARGVLSAPQMTALEGVMQNAEFDAAVSAAANKAAGQAVSSAIAALNPTSK